MYVWGNEFYPLYKIFGSFRTIQRAHDVALNLKDGGREASIILFYKLYHHNSLLRVLLYTNNRALPQGALPFK